MQIKVVSHNKSLKLTANPLRLRLAVVGSLALAFAFIKSMRIGFGGQKMREFSVIIEKDEDGYFVASVPSLRGCHTQAKSLDTLMKRIKEAIELCLEVEKPTPNKFVGVQKVAVNG